MTDPTQGHSEEAADQDAASTGPTLLPAAPYSSPLRCLPPPLPPWDGLCALSPSTEGLHVLDCQGQRCSRKVGSGFPKPQSLSLEARPEGKHGLRLARPDETRHLPKRLLLWAFVEHRPHLWAAGRVT